MQAWQRCLVDARDADSFSDLQDRQDAAYASLNVDCNALEVSEPSPALKVVHNALKVEVAPGKDIHFQRTRRESTSVWAMKEDLDGLKDAASSAAAAIAQLQAASGTVADNIAENAEAAKAGTDGATEKVAELATTVDEHDPSSHWLSKHGFGMPSRGSVCPLAVDAGLGDDAHGISPALITETPQVSTRAGSGEKSSAGRWPSPPS